MKQRRESRKLAIKSGKVIIVGPSEEESYDCKILNENSNGFGFCSDLEISEDHLVRILEGNDDKHTCSIVWRKRIDDPDLGCFYYGVELE